MAEALESRVCGIVADVFGVPLGSVNGQTSRDQVESWDSVNMVNLVMALESEFSIEISIDEASELLSVPVIIALLAEKGVK